MCDAKIRPLPNDTELVCAAEDPHVQHRAILKDYAYPGSQTTIYWYETDRRNFRGEWKRCLDLSDCLLPNGHRGHHAF